MNMGIKILVIEDSDDDYQLLLEHIKNSNLEFTSNRVENATQLKEAIDKNLWDIIISDHRMPNFNSFEALKIVQESKLDIPFILVSGKIGEEVAVEALKKGANDYIMKEKLSRLVPAIEREIKECKNRANEKKMISQLIDSEKRYRTLFEDSKDSILMTNREGIILGANQAATQILGYPLEELIGLNVYDIYFDPGQVDALIAEMEKNGFVKDFHVRCKTKDRQPVDLLFNFTLWKDNEEKIVGYRGIAHDVTLRYRSQKQLDENLEYFAHLIDHIRNPLAILSAFVQVKVEDEKTKDVVIRQVDRIEKLLKELDQGWMETEDTRKFLKNYM